MGRVFFFVLVCLVLYYIFKIKLGKTSWGKNSRGKPRKPPQITDELVKDPVCGVYCPRREAITIYHQGKTYFFCSKECKKKFLDRQKPV